MTQAENYILKNVKIKKDIEFVIIGLRIVSHTARIADYIESSLIKSKDIYHGAIKSEMVHILGNYTILAMHYISKSKYIKEVSNLITFKPQKENIQAQTLISSVNTIIYNASETINVMAMEKENEFYVSQLIIDGIKHAHSLCELIGLSISDVHDTMYKYKNNVLRTPLDIIDSFNDYQEDKVDYKVLDIVLNNGLYAGIAVRSNHIQEDVYVTGDIVKDFFKCTQTLRVAKTNYKYSDRLFEYIVSEKDLHNAYIHEGGLTLKDNIGIDMLKTYTENPDAFEEGFHHILIKSSITSMDDFLDYIYSKKEGE